MTSIVTDDYIAKPIQVIAPFHGDDPMFRRDVRRAAGTLWERLIELPGSPAMTAWELHRETLPPHKPDSMAYLDLRDTFFAGRTSVVLPRFIATAEEAAELPEETIVRTANGRNLERLSGQWFWPGVEVPYKTLWPQWFPLTVIWEPGA